MHRAKKSRDISVQFFSRSLSEQVRQRQELLKDLKVAIANQQLRVHYQPQCDELQGFLLGRPEASPRITPIECF